MPEPRSDAGDPLSREFHTTRWSMIVRAGCAEPEAGKAALETYWYPFCALVR